jgi:hypothetical protein
MSETDTVPKGMKPKPRYRVGDWVTYVVGQSRHACEVIEVYGPVGGENVFYYRLREPMWYGQPEEFDFPETSLEPATQEDLDRRYPPEKSEAVAS